MLVMLEQDYFAPTGARFRRMNNPNRIELPLDQLPGTAVILDGDYTGMRVSEARRAEVDPKFKKDLEKRRKDAAAEAEKLAKQQADADESAANAPPANTETEPKPDGGKGLGIQTSMKL